MANLSFARNKFGLVMGGLVLVVAIVLLVRQQFFVSKEPPLEPIEGIPEIPLTPMDPVELRNEWIGSVQALLEEYDRTRDARVAKERLLTIRVPASGRDAHLALFLALNALSESRPEGQNSLSEARRRFQIVSEALFSAPTSATTGTAP